MYKIILSLLLCMGVLFAEQDCEKPDKYFPLQPDIIKYQHEADAYNMSVQLFKIKLFFYKRCVDNLLGVKEESNVRKITEP